MAAIPVSDAGMTAQNKTQDISTRITISCFRHFLEIIPEMN